MLLGAHVSIAGSVAKAPERAFDIGCETFQIFTKNQMQWKVPPLSKKVAEEFKNNVLKYNLVFGTVHASYLVNIASPDISIRNRSIENLAIDLERAELLNMPYLVFHPGAHKGMGEEYAIKEIAKSINEIFKITSSKYTMLLLETTAGEGTNVGYTFKQLAEIISLSEFSNRIGVCIDTCHIFAAGYDIRSEKGIIKLLKEIEHTVGLEKIKAFHLNDSKGALGSHVDRHAEIGQGNIGIKAFEFLVNYREFATLPGILETPGGSEGYKRNLDILKNLRR
jgi:deoxyribonuclease-4